jgi:hypothetical protein
MAFMVEVVKQRKGWAVVSRPSGRVVSTHATQAEAASAGRRHAFGGGGAEVVIHGADGRVRRRDLVGAAVLDERKRRGRVSDTTRPRAPKTDGERTTLRVPEDLAETVAHLAEELGVSRNDALLRLATRGARQYELERSIAVRADERWAAVVPGALDDDEFDFPSPEQVDAALLALDDEPPARSTARER